MASLILINIGSDNGFNGRDQFLIELIQMKFHWFSLINHVQKSQILLVRKTKLPIPEEWIDILATTGPSAWGHFY